MRLKHVFAVAAVLVVLGLIVRQVARAVHRTFHRPVSMAQLNKATPQTQNGLTLLEVQNVSPNGNYTYGDSQTHNSALSSGGAPEADTGLWIKLPPNITLPPTCSQSENNGCANIFSLTAHLSNGQTLPLRWRTNSVSNTADPVLLLASLPAGYPNTVRWADVTVDDKRGDRATWRITHLPPMQHVLTPPVTPKTIFRQGSITASARAYRGADPNQNLKGPVILCDLTGAVTNTTNDWELGHLKLTREWEPPGYLPRDNGSSYGTSKDKNKVTIEMTRQPIYYDQSQPYLKDIHWVRLGAALQEFATYDETVTFHNVSLVRYPRSGGRYLAAAQPQTVTSHSGVTITLVDVQHEKNLTTSFGGEGISLLIRYPQTHKYPSLPKSPLWRKHNGPVTVSVTFPKPYDDFGSSTSDTEGSYRFRSDKLLPKTITNFPVILRQRVDLRLVPMTFTLPVSDKGPARR